MKVRYSDVSVIQMFAIQIPTVPEFQIHLKIMTSVSSFRMARWSCVFIEPFKKSESDPVFECQDGNVCNGTIQNLTQ